MNNTNRITILFALVLLLASCEHNVTMETTVYPDGKLDKVLTFQQKDSMSNMMGLDARHGWNKKVIRNDSTANTKVENEKEFVVTYEKTFASAEEANQDLAIPNDSLFQVTSTFTKNFRWFYTYLYYSDTYHSLNRMTYPPTDYVTPEDYTFIDRLPAEGKRISKADSLQLTLLNSKLFDVYGLRALFEEHFQLASALAKEEGIPKSWQDTLQQHKQSIFRAIEKSKDIEYDYLIHVMDSLNIPLDYQKVRSKYTSAVSALDNKTNFISHASNGKYTHIINMPWEIVRTNADSVSGNRLLWNPPSIKFLIKDYTMYAESRQLNYWTIALSMILVGFTAYLFLRKRKD